MVKRNYIFEKIRLAIYIFAVILIILAVVNNYEGGCYWREKYGILCPACGLTRATVNFVKLNFKEAYSYNPFYTAVLLPFILFLVINDIFVIIKRKITKKDDISFVEIILGEVRK